MYSYAVGITLNVLELVLFIVGVYYTSIGFFSLFPMKRTKKNVPMYKYAVIIPAHNEAEVLPHLIESIHSANYPSELLTVYVIADECSDKTAEIAENMGAIVFEKSVSSCKGDAISFARANLKNYDFDCIAVFDADNIVDSEFFYEASRELAEGYSAVQGYIDSKNPNDSWVSNAYSIWYYMTNRVMQYGRHTLGLGCRIGGTGFVLTKEVLDHVPWQTETLAEDAEYTCMLSLCNIKVGYVKNAVVYDEKPTDFTRSVRQRRRWTQGIRDVQGEYTAKLIKSGKLNALLGLWGDFLYPFVYVLLLADMLIDYNGIFSYTAGKITLVLYIAASTLISLLALIIDRKMNFKTALNSFGFILYLLSWIPIGFSGVLGRTNKGWYHTRHGSENKNRNAGAKANIDKIK